MSNTTANPTRTSLPELIALNRAASGLKLTAKRVRSRQNGQYLSPIKGRGMEFDESRPYQPGDDVRNIDWRVTARSGNAHTKLFREERERPIFIALDARAPMFFATRGRFKSVIAAELAALLAWTAHQQADRIGGEIFNEVEHHEFRPHRGQKHLLRFLKKLAVTEAIAAEQQLSLENPLRRLNRIAHPGSLVCLISDFRGLDQPAITQLTRIARHNEMLLLHIYDTLETTLPDRGNYRLRQHDRVASINTEDMNFRQRYTGRFQQRRQTLEQLATNFHMHLLHCRSDQSPIDVMRAQFGQQYTSSRHTG
mgnify:CR=1 FL=1